MFNKILAVFTFTALSWNTFADANKDLSTIIDQHWQNAQKEKVFFRTDPDGWKPNGKLAEFTPQAIARREAYNNKVLDISSLHIKQGVTKMLFNIIETANCENN